jgi:hypothetical protein
LRQLVDIGTPQPASQAGHAGIGTRRLANSIAILEQMHGSEFHDPEGTAIETIAAPEEQGWSLGVNVNATPREKFSAIFNEKATATSTRQTPVQMTARSRACW